MFTSLSLLAALGSLSHAAALPTIPQLEVRASAPSFNASLGNVTIFATGMFIVLHDSNISPNIPQVVPSLAPLVLESKQLVTLPELLPSKL